MLHSSAQLSARAQARSQARVPRSRPRREDRAQPARVCRLASHRAPPAECQPRGRRVLGAARDRVCRGWHHGRQGSRAETAAHRRRRTAVQQALLNIIVNAEQALAGASGPRRIEVRTAPGQSPLHRNAGRRQRPGHPARGSAAAIRAIFHHERSRQGHGARPGHRVRRSCRSMAANCAAANRPQGGAMFTMSNCPPGRWTE